MGGCIAGRGFESDRSVPPPSQQLSDKSMSVDAERAGVAEQETRVRELQQKLDSLQKVEKVTTPTAHTPPPLPACLRCPDTC